MSDLLKYDDIAAAGIDDWRLLAQGIHARFETGDFASGLTFVNAVGAAAEDAGHHPDVTLTYPRVDITLISHDIGWVSDRDLAMARRISEIAAEQGISTDPDSVQQVELALDSPAPAEVQPFWRALLGYDALDGSPDEIRDPHGHAPNLWFQDSGNEEGRQRFHFDVWVPGDQVQARIDAVLAAGGTLVQEVPESSFWVVADADGNRSCICTSKGR